MLKRVFLGISLSVLLVALLAVTTFVALKRQEIRPQAASPIESPTHPVNSKSSAKNGFKTLLSDSSTPQTTPEIPEVQPATQPTTQSSPQNSSSSITAFTPQLQALDPVSPPPTLEATKPEALINPPPWPILALLGGGATVLTVVGIILLF